MKIEIGFVAGIAHELGGVSFLGIDDHSGGYNFFSDRVDARCLHISPTGAAKDAKIFCGMKTYYNASKHDFSNIKVYRVVLEPMEDKALEDSLAEETIKKAESLFSKEELAILKRSLQ